MLSCGVLFFVNFYKFHKIPLYSNMRLATNTNTFEVPIDKLYEWYNLLGENESRSEKNFNVRSQKLGQILSVIVPSNSKNQCKDPKRVIK